LPNTPLYTNPKRKAGPFLNQWDLLVLVLFFGLLASLVIGAQQMTAPYQLGSIIPISLDPTMLPRYAISTVIRMGIALMFSLLFTFTVATLAAKSKRAERIILPFIDILQSVPVLGFL
jgi:NitT/TauT family transport system permease protein